MSDHTSCPYCEEHNLQEESPWLSKTGTHHAINETEQLQLFDPDLFNDRRT
jgi:hypothetical protein